jgi:hypothetical protein
MLTYGIREEDVKKAQFGYHLGAGIVAEQVTSMISSPIKRFTPLDQFRIETSPQGGKQGTRLFFGKDISDRLKVSLVTDINTSVAQQMFQAEYLLTDFLLLKGAGSSNSEYRFHLTFRFREQ